MVDAINVFCRDVLVLRGLLPKDAWDDRSLDEAKYEVAQRVADMWKDLPFNEEML